MKQKQRNREKKKKRGRRKERGRRKKKKPREKERANEREIVRVRVSESVGLKHAEKEIKRVSRTTGKKRRRRSGRGGAQFVAVGLGAGFAENNSRSSDIVQGKEIY